MKGASASFGTVFPLIGLQLFSRVFTFILNQTVVGLTSPEILGTATIQFDLLLSTILFLSREGFRNALLRSSAGSPRGIQNTSSPDVAELARRQLITNISILPVFLGLPLAVVASSIYLSLASDSTISQPHFTLSVSLYVLAATIELLSEPLYIRAQNNLELSVRVRAEGIAVMAKALFTLLPFVLVSGWKGSSSASEWSLVAFALGQVAFGLSIFLVHILHFRGVDNIRFKSVILDIHGNRQRGWFDSEILALSSAMTSQSVVKHFLTEGDRLIVSKFSTLQDQGGFALASNYGSLVARIIFQPVEETSRVYFSKRPTGDPSSSNAPNDKAFSLADRKKALEESKTTLSNVLILYAHLSLLFLIFGPPCLPTLLSLILPRRYLYTSAPRVLVAYCWYLPVMAFNGVFEAFFSATASHGDLAAQSRALVVFSALFIIASVVFSEVLGAKETGLVYANAFSLAMRAWYAWAFIKRYYEKLGGEHRRITIWRQSGGFKRVMPKAEVFICSVAIGIMTRVSFGHFGDPFGPLGHKIIHLTTAVLGVLVWFITCWYAERTLISEIQRAVLHRGQ